MTGESVDTATRLAPLLTVRTLSLVMLGGAIGTGLRFSVAVLLRSSSAFPWATFAVNVVGSFAFGFIAMAVGNRLGLPALVLLSGVLGGFTTFSSFSWELWELIERGAYGMALIYAVGCLVAGCTAAVAGVKLGQLTT